MDELVTDPVCRMQIAAEQAVAAAVHEGRRVFFCSESCQEASLDLPHRYVDWPPEGGSDALVPARRSSISSRGCGDARQRANRGTTILS